MTCQIGDDEWHQTFVDTGYPDCLRCRTHHRPFDCPGITETGEEAEYHPQEDT
jgi:hypothetical protein